MEMKKNNMFTEGIETQQRLIGQQLVNQRTENEASLLFQNANAQIQQYQSRINDLEQLASQ
jgi:hypothetical protein